MRELWEKLPRFLPSKWTERVDKIKSFKGQTVSFNDFCQLRNETEHEKSEASERKKEERVVNLCTAICNAIDAGDVPVAMGIIPLWLYRKDNSNNNICVYTLLDNASGGTFINEDSLRRLGVEGSETKFLSLLCVVPKKR